jgi:hypothetical protein
MEYCDTILQITEDSSRNNAVFLPKRRKQINDMMDAKLSTRSKALLALGKQLGSVYVAIWDEDEGNETYWARKDGQVTRIKPVESLPIELELDKYREIKAEEMFWVVSEEVYDSRHTKEINFYVPCMWHKTQKFRYFEEEMPTRQADLEDERKPTRHEIMERITEVPEKYALEKMAELIGFENTRIANVIYENRPYSITTFNISDVVAFSKVREKYFYAEHYVLRSYEFMASDSVSKYFRCTKFRFMLRVKKSDLDRLGHVMDSPLFFNYCDFLKTNTEVICV